MTPLLLSLTLTAPAQPPVFTPPVYSPPVQLAPGVRVQPQIAQYPVYRQPVVYVPVPVVVNPRYPVQPIAPPVVTLSEFSRLFTPTPGRHDVWVVHPVTRQPVKVCFVLPAGRLRDFEVDRRSIRFEFRDGEVEIEFRNNGTVDVRYGN